MRDRTTWGILIGQFAVIVALLWGISLEYLSNQFMRDWIAQNAQLVGYLLNGYFAALMLGILAGGLLVYLRRFTKKTDSVRRRA